MPCRTSLGLAWRTLRRAPLRSGAMLACGAIATALVIAALNLTAAGRARVLRQLQAQGADLLTVAPKLSRSVGGRARTGAIVTTLRDSDLRALRRADPAVVAAAATAAGTATAKAGDRTQNAAAVVGTGPGYFRLRRWSAAAGGGFTPAEQRQAARVALLGAGVAGDLYPGADPVGRLLLLNRVPFRVAGVLTARGQRLDAVDEDEQIFIPLATAQRRLFQRTYDSGFFLEVSPPAAMDQVAADATALLRRRHRGLTDQPDDFAILNQRSVIQAARVAGSRLELLVLAAGGGGLLAAAMALAGLGWMTVGARTPEIGARRALGATAAAIFRQFAAEAVLLAATAAAAGAASGRALTAWAEARQGLAPHFDPRQAAAVAAIAAALNLGFSLLPARRAARLDPIAALRAA
jgi:putative ABC transport system permease protein